MSRLWKLLLVVSVPAILVAMALVIDDNSQVRAKRLDEPLPENAISAIGRIEGASFEIELRPELTGRITEVLAREGQTVEAGQVLLRLDDRQYRQEVALADAELALAQARLERLVNGAHKQQRLEAAALYHAKMAELEQAKKDWQRVRDLAQSKVVSQQEVDDKWARLSSLEKEVEAAKARVELLEAPARPDEIHIDEAHVQAARARLELAKVQLERTQLRAPRKGQILKADIEPGELVGPTSAEPALMMADTSSFRVRAWVEELDAPRVRVGMTAVLTADGLPGEKLVGRVSRLSPRMIRKEVTSDRATEKYDTKTREIWLDLEAHSPLVIGLRVDITIVADPAADNRTRAGSAPLRAHLGKPASGVGPAPSLPSRQDRSNRSK
jgi:HlyD family secretion protein